MDYRKSAEEVLKYIGGSSNIVSAAHCATRLRLVIADNAKCSKENLEQVDGVKGVFEAAGQLQIIFGTGIVNKVFEEFISLAGITGGSKEDVKQAAAAKQPLPKRMIKTLGDIFVPIIPAIVASGLLMGLLEGLSNAIPGLSDSAAYTIFHLFSNAAFVFLPILIAISAAKTFGGNMFLGAVVGMIMIHPDLMNAWSVAGAESVPTAPVWFGLYDINLVGYQGHVIPVVIAVWFMSFIEKKLHKIVPEIIDLFVTPLVSVAVTGYLTLTIIGPVFSTLENWVLSGAKALIAVPLGIGGMLIGAVYAPTVVAGVHHMYNALEAGLLSESGVNTWMPIATAANVAQGAACLAVAFKTKNKKTKSVSLPAALSAYLGITEPAIFGVNVRYGRPFIAGCIGGAAGGLVAGLFQIGASAYGITGLFGFLITTDFAIQYALVMITATVVAFAITMAIFKDPEAVAVKSDVPDTSEKNEATESASASEMIITSPLNGTAIPLTEVPDETFAGEILGKGIAIEPSEGTVYAPCDADVTTLFPTNHAIGLTTEDGVELLIHIGIDTVQLDGKGYKAFVAEGEHVSKGQRLIDFDTRVIEEAGYKTVTPIIVTNTDDYADIEALASGDTGALDNILRVIR
ncbi:MAG: glucose PTS transporter subunit IIA [Lachnospiraceae bacterium]|nr:glucose PTS transporter subunit IIA [Lachnospiraceae bacterium]